MTRGLLLLVKLTVLGALAYWLAEQPGQVILQWQDWRIDTTVGVLLLGLIILAFGIVSLIWLLGAVRHAPQHFTAARRANKREKGYQALTQGLVAVAAGDKQEAQRLSKKANVLLDDPPLTMLLSAQAAQLAGDDKAATKYFRSMQDDPNAAFLGTRGLLMQAIKSGDKEEALRLARKAHEIRPETPWVLRELLNLQTELGQWDDALKTVEEASRHKAIASEDIKVRRAKLLMEKCRAAQDSFDRGTALTLAMEASKSDPDNVSALTTSARLLAKEDKLRKAEKILEDAWKRKPEAAIANTYRDIAGDLAPLKQVKRFEHLLSLAPEHPESHIALARAALKAELWGEARNHLSKLAQDQITPRVCRLMAELEEAEHGNTDAAKAWLERAASEEFNRDD